MPAPAAGGRCEDVLPHEAIQDGPAAPHEPRLDGAL
jgi:hypothetical protein